MQCIILHKRIFYLCSGEYIIWALQVYSSTAISHKFKKAIRKTFPVMFLCNTGGRHGFHCLLALS